MWRRYFHENPEILNTVKAQKPILWAEILFKITQRHLQVMIDSTVIICDHSDHVTAKVDRGEPVQVVRMVMNPPCVLLFTFLWDILPF